MTVVFSALAILNVIKLVNGLVGIESYYLFIGICKFVQNLVVAAF